MPRIVETNDGHKYEGLYKQFKETKEHVIFCPSVFRRVKINKCNIATDTVSMFPDVLVLIGGTITVAIILSIPMSLIFG